MSANVWGGNQRGLSVPLDNRFSYVLTKADDLLIVDGLFDGDRPKEPIWDYVITVNSEEANLHFPLIGYREIDSDVLDGSSVVAFRRIDAQYTPRERNLRAGVSG